MEISCFDYLEKEKLKKNFRTRLSKKKFCKKFAEGDPMISTGERF